MNYIEIIEKFQHPKKEKWANVRQTMGVHINGESPECIFKERRPQESSNKEILEYRLANYRSITVNEFNKAINDIISVAKGVDYHCNEPEKEKEYNQDIWYGWKRIDIKTWFIEVLGRYKQLDPNAIIVLLPKHEDDLLPDYNYELPDFNEMINQKVYLYPQLVESEDIIKVSENHVIFKGGDWQLIDETRPYYFVIDDESWKLIYPEKRGKEIVYIKYDYYMNEQGQYPILPVGQLLNNGYYLPDYWGAAQWGDKAIGQDSDLQICERRFTFPRHWAIKVNCPSPTSNIQAGKCIDVETGHLCTTCGGNGYIVDATPFGTRLIDPNGNIEDSKFSAPEGFVSPPSEILKHSADRVDYYLGQMLTSLGIFKQNMTNQSGVSKEYDLIHKENTVSNIITDIYNSYEMFLNFNDIYTGGSGGIVITLPEKIDVTNESDYQYKIEQAKKTGQPDSVVRSLIKTYLSKKFENVRLVEWLSKYDKLFPYNAEEIIRIKAALGSQITDRDVLLHYQGFELLEDLVTPEMTDAEIQALLTANLPVVAETI